MVFDHHYMPNALKKGNSLHRAPVGEPGRGSFARTFERKRKVYLGSFLGPGGHYDFVREPSGTLVKEQGSLELISDYGAQRARL
jgi:hypothetical protein